MVWSLMSGGSFVYWFGAGGEDRGGCCGEDVDPDHIGGETFGGFVADQQLGGKSPVIVSSCADVKKAARRLFTIKQFAIGQVSLQSDVLAC